MKMAWFVVLLQFHHAPIIAQDFTYIPPLAPTLSRVLAESVNCNKHIPFDSMVGEKVVFRPLPAGRRGDGYIGYHFEEERSFSIPYKDIVGKVATVEHIRPRNSKDDFQDVRLRLDESGRVVIGRAWDGELSYVTVLSDILMARAKWIGKTLWHLNGPVRRNQEEEDGTEIEHFRFQPVKIIDIVAGSIDEVDFVVENQASGRFLVGIRFSASNVAGALRDIYIRSEYEFCTFDDQFSVKDPRLAHKWPAHIWSSIERGVVKLGMTSEQALMAWGKPIEVNETKTAARYTAQWIYGSGRYLYFNGRNRIVALQQ